MLLNCEQYNFNKISTRKSLKMRNLDYRIHWFEGTSESSSSVPSPPPAPWPASKGLQYYDLFLHRPGNSDVQAWRYVLSTNRNDGGQRVQALRQRYQGLPGARVLVIDEQGKPSFVLRGTVARLYNELAMQNQRSFSAHQDRLDFESVRKGP